MDVGFVCHKTQADVAACLEETMVTSFNSDFERFSNNIFGFVFSLRLSVGMFGPFISVYYLKTEYCLTYEGVCSLNS